METSHLTTISDIANKVESLSVWKPASVNSEPHTRLSIWQVFLVKADFKSLGDTIHFVGYAGYEGRVSSPIMEYDKNTHRGVSSSGRIYELVGEPGHNSDATYVWGRWLQMSDFPETVTLTDQYI